MIDLNENKKAIIIYQDILSENQFDAKVQMLLGDVFVVEEEYKQAINAYLLAQKLGANEIEINEKLEKIPGSP